MTLVELFEKDAIENLCSCIVQPPDRVFLIGDKKETMEKHAACYQTILKDRGIATDFISCGVNRNKLQDIINVLSKIVEQYDDCVFDLTGGDDLYLVAMGIVYERYKDRGIQMHRFNINNNTISDCDQDGTTIMSEKAPELTVRDNIRIYGGDIIFDKRRKNRTVLWNMDEEFKNDIKAIWEICRKDPGLWNTQISVFETVGEICKDKASLTVSVPVSEVEKKLKKKNGKYIFIKGIMNKLCKAGLLKSVSEDNDILSITYKNEQVKKCLTMAGLALEMKVFLCALEAKDKDGTNTFNDAVNGVNIDWDGNLGDGLEEFDTANEIDVIAMKGMVPVFISCKNGRFNSNELYKLNTVANRFGGKYAKKVLIATSLENLDNEEFIRNRAAEMKIRIADKYKGKDFVNLSDNEMNNLFRNLLASE